MIKHIGLTFQIMQLCKSILKYTLYQTLIFKCIRIVNIDVHGNILPLPLPPNNFH
jgi:hypothetical protein